MRRWEGRVIASRLGVAIATGLALVLALLVVLGGGKRVEAPDRAVAGVDASTVSELAWTYTDGTPPTRIRRDPASRTGWSWVDPPGVADADGIDAVLSALRGARWHRRAEGRVAGDARATLTITTSSGEHVLAVSAPLEGTEQHWIRRGDDALLVDGWVARALVPDRLALRVKKPLANAASAADIRIVRGATELRMSGSPRTVRGMLAQPALVEVVQGVLADVAITRIAKAPAPGASGLRVELDGKRWIQEAGPCAGDAQAIAVATSDGDGCVAEAAWRAVADAADALSAPPAELVDPRPLPVEAVRVALPDGSRLDLAKRPRIGDADADPVRVTELLAVLVASAAPVALPPTTTAPPSTLVVTDRAGREHTLQLLGNGTVARRGEPIALRIGDGAYALLVRPGQAYREPTLWNEDATAITAIAIDGTTFKRGAVLGEWARTGPGRDEPRSADRLAELLAKLRSIDAVAAPPTAPPPRRFELTVTLAPPNGTASTRRLTLHATPTTCRVELPSVTGPQPVADELCRLAERLTAP
jgi:hypothetical protein